MCGCFYFRSRSIWLLPTLVNSLIKRWCDCCCCCIIQNDCHIHSVEWVGDGTNSSHFFCSVFSLLLFNIIVASFDFISWTYSLCMNWIGKKWDARQLKIVYIFFVLVFIFTERIQFCFISPISYYLYLYSYLNVYVMFSCVHITLMGNSNESKAQQQQQQQHLQIVYIGQATIRCHSSLLNV